MDRTRRGNSRPPPLLQKSLSPLLLLLLLLLSLAFSPSLAHRKHSTHRNGGSRRRAASSVKVTSPVELLRPYQSDGDRPAFASFSSDPTNTSNQAPAEVYRGPTVPCFKLVATDELGRGSIPSWHKYPICGIPDKWRGKFPLTIFSNTLGVRWKGWGTTLGDTASYIGDLEKPEAGCLGDLLFNSSFLGLNMVRYQIPGGYHPLYSPRMASNERNSRGFWPQADRMMFFNKSADTPQVRLLRLALKKGVTHKEAISYSPPWWMTKTKNVEGANRKYESNLRPEYGKKYARYLKTVVDFLESTYRFKFDAIEPFNEPLEGWWTTKAEKAFAHEGCNFNVKEVNEQMKNIRWWFGKDHKISGVDSWVRSMTSVLPKPWQGVDEGSLDWRKFDQLNVHGYRLKDNTFPAEDFCALCGLNNQARRLGMDLWQSEWGPLGIPSASDLELALFMSRKIIQHINLMGVEAWFHWQVINRMNPFWGIIRMRFLDDPYRVFLTKSYFAFRHFSLFMTQGSYPLYVSQRCGHTVLALSRPFMSTIVVYFVNQKGTPRRFSVNFKGFVCGNGCSAVSYVTDETRNFRVMNGNLALQRVDIPAHSLVTVLIKGVRGWPKHQKGGYNPFCWKGWMKQSGCPLIPKS